MKRSILAVTLVLVGALLPTVPAQSAPQIELLNPSKYGGRQVPVVSDKEDSDADYHFVAWVQDVPVNPQVEFELVSLNPTAPGQATLDASPSGPDVWSNRTTIPPGLQDGEYIVRAILYSSGVGVSQTEEVVEINRSAVPPPAPADTVEINYPLNGGAAAFYSPPGGRPNIVMDVSTSDEARQVRAFYTTSDPGNEPAWTLCGTARVGERSARVRCTIAEGESFTRVTGVAAVANDTPPPTPPQAVADESGDAHRVTPVASVPSAIDVSPDVTSVDPNRCLIIDATVTDQTGRPVAGANVDVHATGPDDQLKFATKDDPANPQTDDFQQPDAGNHATGENTHQCTVDSSENDQGEHNRVGAPDDKHIESVGGTGTSGTFTFALFAANRGGTFATIWADNNGDDLLSSGEATGSARIGWGEDPPQPEPVIFIEPSNASARPGECQRMALGASEGGQPITGTNVDVHISGPTDAVDFCAVPDASAGRAPDDGNHTGNQDPGGEKHLEGETDSAGRFVFGVTSAEQGTTQLFAWIDESEDDGFGSGEPSQAGGITWQLQTDRSISLSASSRRVRKGSRVRLSGEIDGSGECRRAQNVKILRRRKGGNRFRTAARTVTDNRGEFDVRTRVRRTSEYRAVAPRGAGCSKARSRIVTVRTRR